MEKLSDVIKQSIEDFETGHKCQNRFCDHASNQLREFELSPHYNNLCDLCPLSCDRAHEVLGYGCCGWTRYDHVIADLKANLKVVLQIEKENSNVVIT